MNQEIRNKLRNVVTQCRKLLEDSISQELEGKYGIFAKKEKVTADPHAKMNHLSDEEQAARKDILDHFAHIKARGFGAKDALDQLIREIAFTHLNRLCAYKMMEAREVYVGGQKFREAVSRGINSNGVKFYLAEHPEEERLFNTGHQDVAYRHFLDWLGGALSDEIGVLFNPNDPANRLYPRQKTLDDVLDLLNGGGIKAEETELREQWPQIWSQDETIGWVYQYFTPKELRDQARKESQAPRNSYELAFRNQFFTPRYVVEFLTDNTLGRIWYEMRKGETNLKDQCRYMVRRPTEIFLKEVEQPPKDAAEGRDDLSREELLKLPVHIPHRPKKDPRELKILDPACGSGHFLLYCFDLLLTIYEEAYADPDMGPILQKDYPKLEDLQRDVPRLILAHNLHGIDIDLRASQIAALALWLRCQRAYQEMGLKKDRPKITRSNFVCAEPMPGEEQMLKEFVSQLEPKVLGQVVEVVFDKMKLAGEAGSLLKIEEEIRDAVAAAKKQYVRETTQATDRKGQPLLFTQAAMDRLSGKPEQPSLFDLSDITDNQFFEEAEGRVIEALRSYAEKAQNGQQLQLRLFTEDAVRGFAVVDTCSNRFDVVLMNPPFGDPSKVSRKYLESSYDYLSNDMSVAFVQRGIHLLRTDGKLGILSPRNPFYLESFSQYRRTLLWNSAPVVQMVDLGFGVLDDAMIETCAFVLDASPRTHPSQVSIIRVLDLPSQDRASYLTDSLATNSAFCTHAILHHTLLHIPQSPFSYFLPETILHWMLTGPYLHEIAEGKWGLFTADDERFVRCWWEVPSDGYWKPYFKGGTFVRFVHDSPLVVNWHGEGADIRTNVTNNGKQRYRIPNSEYYFKSGLTFPNVTFKGLAIRALPAGSIFSLKGPAIFAKNPLDNAWLLALLNSKTCEAFVVGQSPTRRWDLAQIMRIPVPALDEEARAKLVLLADHASELQRALLEPDETSHFFMGLNKQVSRASTLEDAKRQSESWAISVNRNIDGVISAIEEQARVHYGLTEDQYRDVCVITGEQGATETDDEDEEPKFGKRDGICADVISFCMGVVVGRFCVEPSAQSLSQISPFEGHPHLPPAMTSSQVIDTGELSGKEAFILQSTTGILVDEPEHQYDIIDGVRQALEWFWGDRVAIIEREACEILGVKELRDYFRKPGKGGFWDDHISRYSKSRRKAPIYWLLQSSKKNYALWLYYHRLDKDLLFKALVNYVEPKIRLETSRLDSLRSQTAAAGENGKDAKRLSKDLEKQEDFLSELRDFEDKLRRAANLHLEPDLNDGVVLNIAPLWELVPWKEAKKYWDELMQGQYEWSSIGKQLREKGLVK